MSGYRTPSDSGYDPHAYEQPGRPLRPYNWVQWTGVALGTVGVAFALAWLAAKLGWLPELFEDAFPGIMLCLIGSTLINSRREPATLVGEEQLAKNRKFLAITTALLLVVGVTLFVLQFWVLAK